MYRGILISYYIFSHIPFCLICIHNTTEVARLLALTYYLPLFNSQPLNKNHAANLIAEFLLTRPSRDVTSDDLNIETKSNPFQFPTSRGGRSRQEKQYRVKKAFQFTTSRGGRLQNSTVFISKTLKFFNTFTNFSYSFLL